MEDFQCNDQLVCEFEDLNLIYILVRNQQLRMVIWVLKKGPAIRDHAKTCLKYLLQASLPEANADPSVDSWSKALGAIGHFCQYLINGLQRYDCGVIRIGL